MGDDIGLGSVTGCRLGLTIDWHTEMHYVGCAKIKTNGTRTDGITHWLPSLVRILICTSFNFNIPIVLEIQGWHYNFK
jgi:hypothetical protein